MFKIVFHWGPETALDRVSSPHDNMFVVWDRLPDVFASIQKKKDAHATPDDATTCSWFGRTIEDYRMLQTFCQISRMREDDPEYQLPTIFIPTTVKTIHLWTDPNEELPWERVKPTKSKVWRSHVPEFLEGFPYTKEYHGDGPEPSLKKRRREYAKNRFKPTVWITK